MVKKIGGTAIKKAEKKHDIKKGISELEKTISEVEKYMEKVEKQRQKDFGELDTRFYFCVVFDTYEERNKWLEEHNVKLVEDVFVKAKDFIV